MRFFTSDDDVKALGAEIRELFEYFRSELFVSPREVQRSW
jgi:hypothetical protein